MRPSKSSRRALMKSLGVGGGLLVGARVNHAWGSTVASWKEKKSFIEVSGRKMAYVEMGAGRPIVFLHGNPTSSYLWRNIMPEVMSMGRCIAPDLIGMGDSDKLPNSRAGSYSYQTHREFLFEMLEKLGLERDIILVIHDWGSALGFDFASQYPKRVSGIAYMEAILRPPQQEMRSQSAGGFFGALRSPGGEELILKQNMFVEKVLIDGLKYFLTDEDKNEYRRPFLQPGEDRRPTLDWPRELPLDGDPKSNDKILRTYSEWLMTSSGIPKLFVHAVPGAIFANKEQLEFARSFPNQREVTVFGGHFIQEVSGAAIGRAVKEWIASLA
ncbi:MAG: haloalkane dehalogenase [Rhodospirillaceae bacterium]|nr:haloalkane dehalogenase [Rhodospirillaceae bacterium]